MLQAPLFRKGDMVTVLPWLSQDIRYSMISTECPLSVNSEMEALAGRRHQIVCLEVYRDWDECYYLFDGDIYWSWVDSMTAEGMRIALYLNLDFDVVSRRRLTR